MFQNKYPIAYEVAQQLVVERSSGSNSDDIMMKEEVVPVVLLNGFGVGSFHQHRLMRQLLLQHAELQQIQDLRQPNQNQRLLIYGIDYLGQGNSWPANCNEDGTSDDELGLGYSADTWLDQLKDFISEVVLSSSASTTATTTTTKSTLRDNSVDNISSSKRKVHLIGNSVGGYLATILTRRHSQYVASLTLLNATPVWGLNLPGWDGRLPAPPVPKFVGGALFDIIRDPNVINMYLQAAYVHKEAYDGTYDDSFFRKSCSSGDEKLRQGMRDPDDSDNVALGVKIRACTEGKGGRAAFASILWSAPASEWNKEDEEEEEVDDDDERCQTSMLPVDYYATLQNLPVDVLLLFGANDPWCTPAIAKRMHTTLSNRHITSTTNDDGSEEVTVPAQRYISLENVGHCPNHEAPNAVAKVVLPWILNSSSSLSTSSVPTAKKDCRQLKPGRSNIPLLVHESNEVQEPWGEVRAYEISIEESQDLGVIDRIISSIVG